MDLLIILGFTVLSGGVLYFAFERIVGLVVGRTKTDIDDKVVLSIKFPLLLTVILLGLRAGIAEMGEMGGYKSIINSGIVGVLALLWGSVALKVSDLIITRVGRKSHTFNHTAPLFKNIIKIIVWGLILLVILSGVGVDITPLLASAGILGIVLGLGAQETLSNIFSGLAIILDRPYKIHDYIVVEGSGGSEGLRGEVLDIGMRSTKIKTRDNVYLTIPNSIMGNSVIINETGRSSALRIRIKVAVSYSSDMEKVEKVLLKAVWEVNEEKDQILDKKGYEPVVRFREFGDSGILYELLVWIKEPGIRGKMAHLLNRAVFDALRREGIEIPFPQRVVEIKR